MLLSFSFQRENIHWFFPLILYQFFEGGPVCHIACRILIPRAGIELVPSAVKALSLNHWITMETFPLTLYFDKVGNVKAHVNTYVRTHQEVGSSASAVQPSSFSVGFFSVFFCFGQGTMALCFPLYYFQSLSKDLGWEIRPSRGMRAYLSRTFPGLVMGPHVWRTLHIGHAASTCRTFTLHLLMWAIFPRETFCLILCSFVYAGVSSTSSCCVRELIIFLSRYYFLPAYFCLSSQWKQLCVSTMQGML